MKVKEKPKYSIWQNVCFMVQTAWRTHKRVLFMCLIIAAVQVGLNLAQLYVTPEILAKVELGASVKDLLLTIGMFSATLFLLMGLKGYLIENRLPAEVDVRSAVIRLITRKTCETSYPNTRDPKVLKMKEQADSATSSNRDAAEHIWTTLTQILTNVAGFVVYLLLLTNMNAFLILVVVVTATIGFFVSKHINEWEYRHREEMEGHYKELNYFLEKPRHLAFAKDVRIFGLGSWLRELQSKSMKMLTAFIVRREKTYIWANVVDVVMTLLRNGTQTCLKYKAVTIGKEGKNMKKTDQVSIRDTIAIHLRAAKDVNRVAPGFLFAVIIHSAVNALSPYATIWLSAQLINELAFARRPDVLGKWVILIVAVTAAVGFIKAALERWKSVKEDLFYRQYHILYADKFLSMDFADSDKQETRDLFTQIQQSTNWRGWGFNYINMYVSWSVEAVAGILGAVALTVSLFTQDVPETAGALTILNHPLFIVGILAVLLAVTLIGPVLSNKANSAWGGLAEESRLGNRLFSHFGFYLTADKEKAMDLRMYRQLDVAEHYNSVNLFGVGSHFAKLNATTIGICEGLSLAVSAILSGVVYVFVCLKAVGGAFGIGSVTQYVSAVTKLAGNVSTLLQTVGHMRTNAGFLKTVYEFLDIPNSMYQGSLTTEKRSDRQYEVEFKDVSFKYPGSDIWALRHVNMKFKVGKRLAIVGENGSGKTTFIKLLCRLYDPQEGQILLNGIDIRKYRYDDYMNIFSVVFQDFQLICQPLGANVAGSMEYDRDRVTKALIDAGFGDRLTTMEKGLDTMLYKDLSEDGVDVSGGEAQKIAIARALYKDAPFIILDEPTAALDPIAEAEIYSKFNDIAGDKTAIYISHRLSSCKFCDEIAVFHEGAVIQQGTHAELVSDTTGKYYELWNAQAQYYTEKTSA